MSYWIVRPRSDSPEDVRAADRAQAVLASIPDAVHRAALRAGTRAALRGEDAPRAAASVVETWIHEASDA